MPRSSGQIGDAEPRDRRAGMAIVSRPSNMTEPRALGHDAHDGLQRGRLAGAVAAKQRDHLSLARRRR